MDKNTNPAAESDFFAPRTPLQVGLDMADSAWATTADDCGGGEYGTDKFECLSNLVFNIYETLLELGCVWNSAESGAVDVRITELVHAHADADFIKRWTR